MKMQKMNVNELKPHPQNDYFFDDIQGQKWTEFLESVKTSGVIEPIICNQNKVVISGHQRLRACKELGINEVLVDTRIYDNEESIIKDLIETNIRQRGDINSSGLKLGRIIKTLEEAYGIRIGNNVGNKTQSDLAKQLNMSVDTLSNYKKLTTLIPELQELSLEGNIATSVASRVLARLSQEDQKELFNELGKDKLKNITQNEIRQYIKKDKSGVRKAIPKTTQNFIMNRANHKCEVCGCDIDFILQIHHKIKYSDTQDNNADNLKVVCPNCHALLHKLDEAKSDEEFNYIKNRLGKQEGNKLVITDLESKLDKLYKIYLLPLGEIIKNNKLNEIEQEETAKVVNLVGDLVNNFKKELIHN